MADQRADIWLSRRQWRTIGLVALLLVTGYVAWRWLTAVGGPTALRDLVGPWAPALSVPAHVVLAATPFPSEVIGVANGSIYGLWRGTLCGWISWWSGGMIVYALARRGTNQANREAFQARLPGLLKQLPISHPAVLIIGRQLPFCFHAVNALAGIAGVSLRRQAVTAAISNLIFAFITAATGAGVISAW